MAGRDRRDDRVPQRGTKKKTDVLDEQLARGLARHLRARLPGVITEHLDTMKVAGIAPNVRQAIIIRNLILQAAVIAVANGAPRHGYLQVCEDIYNEALRKEGR